MEPLAQHVGRQYSLLSRLYIRHHVASLQTLRLAIRKATHSFVYPRQRPTFVGWLVISDLAFCSVFLVQCVSRLGA